MTEPQAIDRESAEDTSISAVIRWSRVMGDLDLVAKTGKYDDSRGTKYDFRGVEDVVNAAGPLVRKHGLIIRPELVSVSYEMVTRAGGTPARACQVVVKYIATGPNSDEYVIGAMPGEAFDTGDKAVSKATSVAWRIALSQGLTLPTGETDPDSTRIELGTERPRRAAPTAMPDPEWLAAMHVKVKDAETKAQLQDYWRQAAKAGRDGKCSEDEVLSLHQAIQARTGEISAASKPAPARSTAQRSARPAADQKEDGDWPATAPVPNGQAGGPR